METIGWLFILHSVPVIRTVRLNGTPLRFPLSGQRGVRITNFEYSFPVNRIPIIRTVRITGNRFCPDNESPVNGSPDNGDRVYIGII